VDAGSTAKAQLLVRKKYQNFIIFIDCFCRLSTRQNCLEFHSMSDDSAPMDHENLVRKKKKLKKKKKNLTLKSLHRHSRSLPFDAICARCNATERLYRQFDSQHVQFSFFFCPSHHDNALRTAKSRPLSVAAIWRLLHSICTTLESLRVARIIHGDIRPQNILVLPV
jgi:hypothetical protein